MSSASPSRAKATWNDLAAIPEEERRHEIVGGDIVPKEAASGRHGGAQGALCAKLFGAYSRRPGGRPPAPGGWWFATEAEVELEPHEIFRPDIAGWHREHLSALPAESPIRVRPDWICEILSKNRRNDLIKKKRVYHRNGVPHYWIVDPVEETLTVYRFAPEGTIEVLIGERGDRVRAEPFQAVDLLVGVLFGDDDPAE